VLMILAPYSERSLRGKREHVMGGSYIAPSCSNSQSEDEQQQNALHMSIVQTSHLSIAAIRSVRYLSHPDHVAPPRISPTT
jgi:hypothetical protein